MKSVVSKTRIFFIVSLAVSAIVMSSFAWRVYEAMHNWQDLKHSFASFKEVDKALKVVNDAERDLVPYLVVTVALSGPLIRSIDFKLMPRYCFYCRRQIHGKDGAQSPDRLFWFCGKCLEKRHER